MNELAQKLAEYGENVSVKHNRIHVKLSPFVPDLTISKDIATNSLIYSYGKWGNFIGIIAFCVVAGNLMVKGDYVFSMFCIGLALSLTAGCVINEFKVTNIKQQVRTILTASPHLQSIDSLTTDPIEIEKNITIDS